MRAEARGIDDVLQRIQGEFVEMPGLRLTAAQAQRLWGLEREFCNELLSSLVDAKFLEQTRDGAFVRLEGARPTRLAASLALARSAVA
jgi:RecB family exonuclease